MAARKTGLGRGIDGLFPSYGETGKAGREKTQGGKTAKDSPVAKKNPADGKKSSEENVKKKAGKDKSAAADSTDRWSEEKQMEETAPDAVDAGVVMVRLSSVEPNRQQPRKAFDEDSLQELAESIRQHGIIQPLLVQKKKNSYEIIAGERRWRAAKIAGLKEVPVLIREYTKQEVFEISLIENIQREDLNPIEEALAYRQLLEEFQLKQDEVAERVAKNRSTITNALRLLKLDPRVQQMLTDEKITAGHARALLQLEDPEQQYEIAQQIFDRQLSVREVEKMMKLLRAPKTEPKPVPDTSALDLICQTMEERMAQILGTKVSVHRRSEKKGRVEIEYYSNDELERIYDLIKSINIDTNK